MPEEQKPEPTRRTPEQNQRAHSNVTSIFDAYRRGGREAMKNRYRTTSIKWSGTARGQMQMINDYEEVEIDR